MFALYLKSLEIQGFKSFPTQTRLTFEKPITGIVGPNGSGKSNIADAMLWVMGEQSTKTLRSGKMEDVIFGGTLRRPQQNFAEVSLILDNSDGHLGLDTSEVMLTRRCYRSGESEYYINRSMVRLKEVTELLMDTGLGREGYSVIGQGKIAEILSTKSKDRRDIFEEAAGISKYRHKKDEAERKLAQTEDNLLRIGDRISELELQVGPLREQAETAKKYLLLNGELRGVEISLWLKELETIGARTQKAENDFMDATRGLDAKQIELDEIFSQSESLSSLTADGEKDAQSIRDLISAAEHQNSEADAAVAVLKSELNSNLGQIEHIKSELESSRQQQDGVGTQISSRETRLSEISRAKKQKDGEITALSDELESIMSVSGESVKLHSELIKKEQELQSAHSNKKSEFSGLVSTAQELYDMEESVKQELLSSKDGLKALEAEHKKQNSILQKARDDAISLDNIIGGLTIKANNRAKKAELSGEKLERLSFDLKTLKSRQMLLREMEKDYQGYHKSVKMIMQEYSRGALNNIHGTVGSQVKTDDAYTIAIETALGGSLQNIIVDTEEDGKAAINLLKRRDGGRATFLPISTINGNCLDEAKFKNDEGFIGLAINLIKYNSKFSGIYNSLLGRVIIMDDLSAAIRLAKKHNHQYKIVTQDGQVINKGGSMTGGSAASTVGVLSRANELEQLESRIKASDDDLAKAEREHAECVREKTAAEYELETALGELRLAQEDIMKHEIEKTHREQNIQTINEKIKSITAESSQIESRLSQNSADTESLTKTISALESEISSVGAEIESAIRNNELFTKERERVNLALGEIRSQTAALDAERESLLKAVAELMGLRDEMSGSRERQIEMIGKLEQKNNLICTQIKNKEQDTLTIRTEISLQKERLSKLNDVKIEIEAKRSGINKIIKDKTEELSDKQRKVSSCEMKLQAIKNEEETIIDKLWSTYELSRSAAINHGTPIDSPASARRRINAIRRELDELGPVNPNAIKEYERVSERYENYTAQRDDVQNAKGELLGIIDDLTSRMRDIFTREFNLISEKFESTFKELFGGGTASLFLEDPDDVLGCGIEIKVQPPGKSLKTITLLSGGEKAFVAIAIYFAILSVRPPPFVVMDEIDTALDEANVLRFADYMRHMSSKTQMIVISHKRGTMEETDVLYGITMQELGVSNILCVDLDEAEKHLGSRVSV
ncbi:MAG: chromosome segregation protein SMC [Oscillospiraceae bacterium]|nr:chromosome segregation protein SMC [Oscillospiraceae bacterium]